MTSRLSFTKFLSKFIVRRNLFNTTNQKVMFEYPTVFRDESITDDFFGKTVLDPYRWLENPESEETRDFINSQNAVTFPYVEECPFREKIWNKITAMWDFPKYSTPVFTGDRYFQIRNSGLENQDILYVSDNFEEEGRVFVDPNNFSAEGTVALGDVSFGDDFSVCAYSLTNKGSDWMEIRFKNTETGEDYEDVLKRVKFSSMTWKTDNSGLFYGAYLDRNGSAEGTETDQISHQKLYFHKLGTFQEEDITVVEFSNPQYLIGTKICRDNYLLVTPCSGTKYNLVYYTRLPEQILGPLELNPVITEFVADFKFILNNENLFYFFTNKDSSNGKVIKIDVKDPGEENWEIVIAEHKKNVIEWVKVFDENKLIICYLSDVKHMLQIFDVNTGEKIKDLDIEVGSISNATCRRHHKKFFYGFTSFLTPKQIHQVTFDGDEINDKLIQESKIEGESFDKDFETKQVFYKTKDSTNIPMFLIHNKSFKQNGTKPCVLYGYGGFGINITPNFSLARLLFARHFDGVLAIANIRGGGEYGIKWHDAGRYENKQNCFDDFQYAARFLIGTKYTCAQKLVIQGASNGGLLVGACINQAPELFGAAIAHVGVMDMLRFHKFTIGYAWKRDYGFSEDPDMFDYLIRYSPLHNVKQPEHGTQYPATLLLTADHDDRVVPLHSLKYIAELQNKIGKLPNQKNPLMIRVDTNSGHGAGKSTAKKIEEMTDIFCFISNALHIPFLE